MRPLDSMSSIKMKIGVVIVAAVAVTIIVVTLSLWAGIPLVVAGLAAGAVALAMVKVLARGLTAPLRQMAAAARAMEHGDYTQRVGVSSRDEVGELAHAFNRMAAELAEVDRMRRDLIANVSHELRTPISALQVLLENIIDGVADADSATLKTMLGKVDRLGRLVTQLLDLSKLESGSIPLQPRMFGVKEVFEDVLHEAATHPVKQDGGKLTIELDVSPESLAAYGDPERIRQVVANLVDNAVRHSPADGKVTVAARPGKRGVTMEVTDEGPGISVDEASRVFERFYRSDAARSYSDGGSGLGLAISRWIVDLHGGEIRVDQGHPRGCRMVVTLPTGTS